MNALVLATLLASITFAEPQEGRSCFIDLEFQADESQQLARKDLSVIDVYVRSESEGVGGAADEKRVLGGAPVPSSQRIELEMGSSWRLSFRSEALWAPDVLVALEKVCSHPRAIFPILVFPVAEVQGEVLPPFEPTGQQIKIHFESDPADFLENDSRGVYIGRHSRSCAWESSQFRCSVPATQLDLRLEMDGFAPIYFWGQRTDAKRVLDLGPLKFQRGGSVVGWVESVDDDLGVGQAKVAVQPQVTGWIYDPADRRRLTSKVYEAQPNKRGFFQVIGLAEGVYSLEASREGLSTGSVGEIRVKADQETILEEPVVLLRPESLEVYVDPPVGPNGQPWVVELLALENSSNVARIVDRSEVAHSGYWRLEGLAPSVYSLGILDTQSSYWLKKEIELIESSPPIFLKVGTVAVQGRVLWGDEPFATNLVFGTRHRRPNIRLRTDEEGEFRGALPRTGRWRLEVEVEKGVFQALEPVDIEMLPDHGHAWIDIAIPETEIEIEVSKNGEPADAMVLVKNLKRKEKVTNQAVSEEGKLTIRGLVPGNYSVMAYDEQTRTGFKDFEVKEGHSSPIHIDLEETKRIRGSVLFKGAAIAGARIVAYSQGEGSVDLSEEKVTDAQGRFEVSLPGNADSVDLLVLAAGLGIHTSRHQTDVGEPLEILLGDERSTLVLGSRKLLSYFLSREGALIPMQKVFSLFMSAGFIEAGQPYGLSFLSLEPGRYRLCPGRVADDTCLEGYLAPNSQLMFQ